MIRVLLDTNVVVASLRSRLGASALVMEYWYQGRFETVASVALFLEYEDVLKRPEHKSVHRLDDAAIEALLDIWSDMIVPVDVNYRWRPQLSDARDELVLEAAVNGNVDAIVTFNTTDFADIAPAFGLFVWRPVQLLRRLIDKENEP